MAVSAATAGDAPGTTGALADLAERERFVATVLLGLVFPRYGATSRSRTTPPWLPSTRPIDWQGSASICSSSAGRVACDDVPTDVLGRLLRRGYYGSGNRAALAVVRARLARGRVERRCMSTRKWTRWEKTIERRAGGDRRADEGRLGLARRDRRGGVQADDPERR